MLGSSVPAGFFPTVSMLSSSSRPFSAVSTGVPFFTTYLGRARRGPGSTSRTWPVNCAHREINTWPRCECSLNSACAAPSQRRRHGRAARRRAGRCRAGRTGFRGENMKLGEEVARVCRGKNRLVGMPACRNQAGSAAAGSTKRLMARVGDGTRASHPRGDPAGAGSRDGGGAGCRNQIRRQPYVLDLATQRVASSFNTVRGERAL